MLRRQLQTNCQPLLGGKGQQGKRAGGVDRNVHDGGELPVKSSALRGTSSQRLPGRGPQALRAADSTRPGLELWVYISSQGTVSVPRMAGPQG